LLNYRVNACSCWYAKIPSGISDSAEGLSKFLTTNKCSKCAYVIPVYEVDRKSKFPETKKELKKLVEQKKARCQS
jgi:hypothetical protein